MFAALLLLCATQPTLWVDSLDHLRFSESGYMSEHLDPPTFIGEGCSSMFTVSHRRGVLELHYRYDIPGPAWGNFIIRSCDCDGEVTLVWYHDIKGQDNRKHRARFCRASDALKSPEIAKVLFPLLRRCDIRFASEMYPHKRDPYRTVTFSN